MKKNLLLGSVIALVWLANGAWADEKSVRSLFEQRFPGAKAESVTKEPLSGLYEIFMGGQVLYADEGVNYVIQGSLVNAKTRQNLTAERLKKLTEMPFDKLPFDQAIKIVKGNGSRKLAVFEDPDCPFCKQLETELRKVDDVTLYVFLYPLEQLHPGSTTKSMKIWCAPDRAKAWLGAMQDGTIPEGKGECDNPVAKLAEFGRSRRITGTPTMIFENGTRVAGAVPAGRIEQLLGENVAKQ
ncbi:DsbC family protein [Pseudogulbenkiania ferrooxidans]|uniref:Thiol:disulfide interchange protein n=1 Tax=Pseudogulbenkiania ferrooxidans 2002 TaxID=279714 RepID=B9Z6B1_9NEIS|nr:DsbC family protein [Pseudogulbenkiania ferrooxidans]EEG07755.1 putative thiol:disulphide interchange protein [Pseudogulbenkiania ferrooxidans 2002]